MEKTMSTKPEFTTAAFERSNTTKPRGFGTWAFQATRTHSAFEGERHGEIEFISGTLTEAKRTLAAKGATGLWAVLP